MKQALIVVLLCSAFLSYSQDAKPVHQTIDKWHKAASEADADTYFGLMTKDAVFVGTDSTEVWNKSEFQAFAEPYFKRGSAWDFEAFKRNVYFDDSGNLAWFEESLNTWMGVCRGSGVLAKTSNGWMVKHYVLSVTIPNEKIQGFINLVYGDKPFPKRAR